MNALLKDLRETVRARQAFFIVGAGVSIATTQRAPTASWKGLLQHGLARCIDLQPGLAGAWATRVRGEISSGDLHDLLSAAEKISSKLDAPTGGEYRRWLRESIGTLEVVDSELIEAIASLRCPVAKQFKLRNHRVLRLGLNLDDGLAWCGYVLLVRTCRVLFRQEYVGPMQSATH